MTHYTIFPCIKSDLIQSKNYIPPTCSFPPQDLPVLKKCNTIFGEKTISILF